MSQAPIDAVLAGTKPFAVALLAPLTTRVGVRPRIAADPGQALALCARGGLAVVEYLGQGSLPQIERLVKEGGLRVVAGVAAEHAAAEAALRALGVDAVRWDGRPEAILGAVDRQLGGAPPPAPRAAPPAPAAAPRPAPVQAPRPAPASGAPAVPRAAAPAPQAPRPPAPAPRPPPPPGAAPAPRATPPAGPPPPAVARAPAGQAAPRPAAPPPAARPAPVVPPARPPAAPPVASPPRPMAPAPPPAAARVAAPATPASRPPAAAPPLAPPPAVAPPPGAPRMVAPPRATPSPGAPRMAAPPPAAAPAAAPPVAAPPPAAPAVAAPASMQEVAAAAPEAVDALFGDLMVDPPAAPAPAFDFRSPGVYVPPPSTPAVAAACWPATAPSDGEAEAALLAAIAGTLAESAPLGAVAGQVVDGLSELELAVLQGAEQPVDTAPVRRAAVTRLRVAAALAALPAPGSPVDGQAVQALLAAIDGLLAEVNVLFGGAPPELQPGLEAVRNALVKEAIDFSEAAQRVGTPAAPVAAPVRREAQARVVSIDAIPEAEPDRRGRRLAVVTAIAVALALGFHGYGWWQRTHVSRTPVVPGLPPGLVGSPPAPGQAAAYTISSDADRVEIEKFKQQQISLGKQVKEVGGALVILPAPPGAPSSAPEPK